jgi:ferrous iron transport protein A
MRNLSELQSGEMGIIAHISDPNMACKIMSMGLTPGVKIQIVRIAPFGNTMYIKSGNLALAIRKVEAKSIEVY